MFRSFYDSFWQHPLLLWLFPLLFLVLVRPRRTVFGLSCLVFAVLTIVDPLMTGPVTAALGLEGVAADAIMIVFVLLGDFRFFFFVEYFSKGDEGESRSAILRALGLTLVVPVVQAILIRVFHNAFENPRHTFLAYELLFLIFALLLRVFWVRRARRNSPFHAWISSIYFFAMAYYALWALADVIILSGHDLGYLLRVVPNVLYYGLFIPFVFWKAPEGLKKKVVT